MAVVVTRALDLAEETYTEGKNTKVDTSGHLFVLGEDSFGRIYNVAVFVPNTWIRATVTTGD